MVGINLIGLSWGGFVYIPLMKTKNHRKTYVMFKKVGLREGKHALFHILKNVAGRNLKKNTTPLRSNKYIYGIRVSDIIIDDIDDVILRDFTKMLDGWLQEFTCVTSLMYFLGKVNGKIETIHLELLPYKNIPILPEYWLNVNQQA